MAKGRSSGKSKGAGAPSTGPSSGRFAPTPYYLLTPSQRATVAGDEARARNAAITPAQRAKSTKAALDRVDAEAKFRRDLRVQSLWDSVGASAQRAVIQKGTKSERQTLSKAEKALDAAQGVRNAARAKGTATSAMDSTVNKAWNRREKALRKVQKRAGFGSNVI